MVYTKQEAAAALKIAPVTVDRNRQNGKLPFHKIGRRVVFTQGDLDQFLKNCAVVKRHA